MCIKTAVSDGVTTIEIARPEKRNALTIAMYQSMSEAIEAAVADPATRALLIRGQPGIFTAGNDLEDFLQRPPTSPDSPVFRFMRALALCDKPVVAAVSGAAIGIGTTMLLHCDLVYVSEETRLAMPFVSLGVVPEFASSFLLPRLLGHVIAAEKLLLGEPFTAAQAVELGIANAVLPAANLLEHAWRAATRFNELPLAAVRATKRLMRAPVQDALLQAMQTEADVFAQRLRSPEAREAFEAFFQKRKPDFRKFS